MRSDFVVVNCLTGNHLTDLLQRLKSDLIQTFVPELAIKALDVGVLRWAARLDQDVLDTVLLCPCHECPASELRPVVSSDSLGVAYRRSGTVRQTGHVMPANAKVGGDVHALVGEVIIDCQALDSPRNSARPRDRVTHKVHASQVWLEGRAATRGTRTPMPLVFLRFPMDTPSAV